MELGRHLSDKVLLYVVLYTLHYFIALTQPAFLQALTQIVVSSMETLDEISVLNLAVILSEQNIHFWYFWCDF